MSNFMKEDNFTRKTRHWLISRIQLIKAKNLKQSQPRLRIPDHNLNN